MPKYLQFGSVSEKYFCRYFGGTFMDNFFYQKRGGGFQEDFSKGKDGFCLGLYQRHQ
jgi:hypothetical protein